MRGLSAAAVLTVFLGAFLPVPGAAAAGGGDLDAVRARLEGKGVIRGDFTQTKTLEAFSKPVISSGSFTVARDRGVIWGVESPYRIIFVAGAGGFLEVHPDGTVRSRGPEGGRSQSHISRLFGALFAVDTGQLGQYFDVRASNGQGDWRLELTPLKEMAHHLEKVEITGADFVSRIFITEAGGDTVEVTFRDQSNAETLTDEEKRLLALE